MRGLKLITVALSIFFADARAQRIFKDLKPSGKITLAEGDTVKIFSIDQKRKKSINHNIRYYYFDAGNLHSNVGGYSGRLLHGTLTVAGRNGQLFERGNFSHGYKAGQWIVWNANGNIKAMYMWKAGVREGKFQEYQPNGKVLRSGRYKNGKLNGQVTILDATMTDPITLKYKDGALVPSVQKGLLRNLFKTKKNKPENKVTIKEIQQPNKKMGNKTRKLKQASSDKKENTTIVEKEKKAKKRKNSGL